MAQRQPEHPSRIVRTSSGNSSSKPSHDFWGGGSTRKLPTIPPQDEPTNHLDLDAVQGRPKKNTEKTQGPGIGKGCHWVWQFSFEQGEIR